MSSNTLLDTLHNIDKRFSLAESDAKLQVVPETHGSRRIGVAIIGVGRMGAIHLYNVLREPRANVLYVLDTASDRLDHMDRKYYLSERGIKVVHTDQWQAVLDDKRVEAVLISTPTFTHEQYARSALEHNKHVLCEKPLAKSIDAINSLSQLAASKKLTLICAFNRRYDPSFRAVSTQVKRGDVGQVRLVRTCSRDSPLPPMEYIKISGGLFHDCVVHDLDVVLWMTRELPCEVHTFAHTYDPKYAALNDFDTALVSMKFPSGCMAVIDVSRHCATGYEQRVEVFGPKGHAKIDEFAHANWEKHTENGMIKPTNDYSFVSRFGEAYANEILELFNHIEGNQTLEPLRYDYTPVLCKVVNAVEESARTDKSVKLDWTENEKKAVQ